MSNSQHFDQRLVKFDDYTPPDFDPYESNNKVNDTSSVLTRATTGILAADTSVKKNDLGQTEAEAVAHSYRSFPERISEERGSSSRSVDRRMSDMGRTRSSRAPSRMEALSYRDEDTNHYSDLKSPRNVDQSEDSLVRHAARMGSADYSKNIGELEYQDPSGFPVVPPEEKSFLARYFAVGRYPIEQRIENKKRGIGRQRYPFLSWALAAAMTGVLIYELVLNARQQGTPVSFKPTVNPMLGPSESALINLGARFPPCMKDVAAVPVTLELPCMNDTANPPDRVCPISELCGFGGLHDKTPNQWFRFITPIFLHAGIVHLVLNMFTQVIVSAQIEREMGSGGFFLVYFAAGIFGNVLGGNFALVGVPSVGASGAIFGTVAVTWVDLFAHWKYHYKPGTRLIYMTIELLIGIAVGFIPYVDNFAHLGGLLMGLLVGTIFYPVISETKRHKAIMWGFRIAAVPVVVVLFVVLIRNFYTSDPYSACSWCRYLSCIPTSANNHCKGTGITTTTVTTTTSSLRMLLL